MLLQGLFLALTLVCCAIIVHAAIEAWRWWRLGAVAPQPPSRLVVGVVALTLPLAIGLADVAGVLAVWLSGDRSNAEPSEKARRLGEAISGAMNVSALATVALGLLGAVVSLRARRLRREAETKAAGSRRPSGPPPGASSTC